MAHLLSLVFILTILHPIQSDPCPNPWITDECKHCSSHDDPHFRTWDAVGYDQHTDACFKYVTTCPSAPYDMPFEVCGCHYDCGSGSHGEGCPSTIRCVGDITITYFDLTLATTSFEVTVDQLNPTLEATDSISATSLTSGGVYTFDTAGHYFTYDLTGSVHTFEVFSSPSSSVYFYAHIRYQIGNFEIHLNEDYFTDVACGLCGYFTGIDVDDFLGADGLTYLTPSDLNSYPASASVVQDINDFANTYLCSGSGAPFDPGCAVGADDFACFNETLGCCEDFWDLLAVPWENSVLDEAEFYENWLINCALDACALTFNSPDCAAFGNEFSFAKNIAVQSATADYAVLPPQTTAVPDDFESNCTAKVCAHGDNRIQLDVSYDSGSTWDLAVAAEGNWKNTMEAAINPVDGNTVLRFTIIDVGHVGGFIATVTLCGTNGYIFSFFTDEINTYFDVISDSTGDPLIDVFDEFGTGSWAGFVNEKKVECMNPDADWIWNDQTYNTMVFELDFGHHTSVLERLECIAEDTPEPTRDCCDLSLDDYLGMCYCEDTTTPEPTPIDVVIGEYETDKASMSGAYSAGSKVIGDNGMKHALYGNIKEEMKEIKYMIYATWVIIFSCFMINIGLTTNCRKKKSRFKSVSGSDGDL